MSKKGVTLLEFLSVIVIMSVLAAVAIPTVGAIVDKTQKDKIYYSAVAIENAAVLYCTEYDCPDETVLTSSELSGYLNGVDPSYTYEVTKLPIGYYAVRYYKDNAYSFPFSSEGNELTSRVPSLSSPDYVNVVEVNVDSGDPVIPVSEPYVLLNGDSTVYVEIATSFDDPGAVAYTSSGDVISNTWIGGYVDFWHTGTYERDYEAYSSYDNKDCIKATRTIIVVDTTPPVIIINGAETFYVKKNSYYSDWGAYALDNSGANVNVNTTGVESVNIKEKGTYYITYTAVDPSGNKTVAVRTVIVK